jgi:CheY-like chemotaxis protein
MRTLRDDPSFEQTAIVAFTAHALDFERKAALESGFDEVIARPCLPEDLAVAIDRLLATPRVPPSSGG